MFGGLIERRALGVTKGLEYGTGHQVAMAVKTLPTTWIVAYLLTYLLIYLLTDLEPPLRLQVGLCNQKCPL